MPPSSALQHVSQVLTCLMYQHAHFEANIAPPKLAPVTPIPDEVSIRVRRLFPEEVTSELARLRRWLPSFADGEKGTWGDVADCLVHAIDALPVDAKNARQRCEEFANNVLNDAVQSAEEGDVGNNRLKKASMKTRHARLLLDSKLPESHATVSTLVAAGYVIPASTALIKVLASTKEWEAQLEWLSKSSEWRWSGDGSVGNGKNACEAAVAVFKFVLDEMVKPATHGAQRRPLALVLATIIKQISKGGALAEHIETLPVKEMADLGEKWSEKKNAAAENSALLQASAALRRRIDGPPVEGTEPDPEAEKLDHAVHDALLTGLTAEKEESKESALECLADYLDSSKAPTRELLLRAVSVGGAKGPSPNVWVLVQSALKSAARADPKLALDVAEEMLKSSGAAERVPEPEDKAHDKHKKDDKHHKKEHKSMFGGAKALVTGRSAIMSVAGAGTARSRVVALRFLSWVLGTDSEENTEDDLVVENAAEERERLAAAAELRRRAPSLAAAVGVALRPPPPSGTWYDSGNVTYLSDTKNPDAPEGDDVAVMLTALRCSPLLLNPAFSLAETRDYAAEETNFLAVALASGCGHNEVEAAARRAIRRHVTHVSPTVLRRAVVHSLRAAESAIEGSVKATEWTCRLSTAAVTVAEAARRPTEDVLFDAAAVGPRAATAILLASAHPDPQVHAVAASLLVAAEDLVDVAALSGDAMGHGADAGEDAENSITSKLGGGLLRWLSSQASVGPETRDRAVSILGGWNDDERVAKWRGGELSAASDAGVRRALERLAAARVVEYAPSDGGDTYKLWKWHVAFYVAASRPVGHVPVRGGSLPLPGQASLGNLGEASPGKLSAKKMLFPEDKPGLSDLGFRDNTENDMERSLALEKDLGLDGNSEFDSAIANKRVWSRCAAAAEEGGRESFSPSAARSARRRGEALSDALVGAAPPCIAAVVSVVAADVVTAAATTQETLGGTQGSIGAKEAKTLWPALARAACGLGLLRAVASRVVARCAKDAAAFVDETDTPESTAFEDALRLTWAACDAWLPALPDVARQAYSSDYGDDGVLTDDDGVAAASRAAKAAASLAALRLRVAPPTTTATLDQATQSLVDSLPQMRGEWRAFANVVLEAINVVVVAAGAPREETNENAGDKTKPSPLDSSVSDAFGDGPPLTHTVADIAVRRLAEASRVASRDVEQRAAERAACDKLDSNETELDSPLAILNGARKAGALVTAACAELLARTPSRAASAAAASALQAAGTATAAAESRLESVNVKTFNTPLASPMRLLDPIVAAVGDSRAGLVAAASLISMRLSPSLAASASAHRALRAVAGATAGPETTAAAAAAADATDAAATGKDFALAAEARRGAAMAATSAFVNISRPEATARVEATAEGVFDLASALAQIDSISENGDPTEDDDAKGRRVWCAAAAAAEPAVALSLRKCVAAAAAAALETVNALVIEVPAPATREVATSLARATLEAAPSASEDAGASFWHTLGGKIVGNLGFEGDNGTDTHFEALELASDAAAAVVDTLVEACAAESADTTPTNHEVSALAALRFLRSESGAAAAPRLVELVELVEGGDADVANAKMASAAMRLVTAAMACPLASATFAPWLPSLAASATARRATSRDAAALVAALRIAPIAADARDVPNAVVREVAGRFPKGRLAFRKAAAECAMRAAETAVADGSADFCATSAEAATRLFEAAVRGRESVSDNKHGKDSASSDKKKPQKPSKPFPTAPLALYASRLARIFTSATSDARGVAVAVAAADAMSTLAERFASAGHLALASVDASVVTRLCVAVSLSAIALPNPSCVAAGVRLAVAAGLTSSTRLKTGVAPAVVAALKKASGANPAEAAAAVFSRVMFLPEPAGEDDPVEDAKTSGDAVPTDGVPTDAAQTDAAQTDAEPAGDAVPDEQHTTPTPSAAKPVDRVELEKAKDARADILDVACGVLSALPEDDGMGGSLDEFAILTCCLLTWPSIGAPPDANASDAAVNIVTGLGVESLQPVADRFTALANGEYGDTNENGSEPFDSPSPSKKEGLLRTKHRKARRVFFKDACRAMGAAGCTSPSAWAQALRALAAAAATAKRDPDARLAAADLLCAWLDARVAAEGVGAWETKALAAAASELVDMDDAAVAPACSALASREVTAEPAAVVDAVLLGDVTPHVDDATTEDVKVRLAPWELPEPVPGAQSSPSAPTGKVLANATPRVRGVSVAGEDRLRRWARGWLVAASAAADSLLAGNKRGAAGSGISGTPTKRQSQSAEHLSDEETSVDSGSSSEDDNSNTTRFVLAGGPLGDERVNSGEETRVPFTLGTGWGVVDPLFAVMKSPAGTGGTRIATALLSPVLAAKTRQVQGGGGTPQSLGGALPATSRRDRRRARALGLPVDSPLIASSTSRNTAGITPSCLSTNPFARRNSPPADKSDEILVERLQREGDMFVAGESSPRGDDGSSDDDEQLDGRTLSYSAANPSRGRRGEQTVRSNTHSKPPKSPQRKAFGLPPAPESESSVDDLVRGLGEMQAFELDLGTDDTTVSPGERRQMRDQDYKEATRRAKEISAARRAERALLSPGRQNTGTPANRRHDRATSNF